MKIKAAIFDMDGLMFDTERLFLEAFRQAVAPATGLSFPENQLKRLLGLNFKAGVRLFREMFPEADQEACYDMKRAWCRDYIAKNGVPVKPGLFPLLEHLKALGIPAAVASSTNSVQVEAYLEQTGVRPYFARVIGGEMIERGKPDPDIFLRAARLLGQMPEDCLVLEDSENGLLAASAAKIPCIIVPDLIDPTVLHPGLCFAKLKTLDEAIPLIQ